MNKLKNDKYSRKSFGFENDLSNSIIWIYHPNFSFHLEKIRKNYIMLCENKTFVYSLYRCLKFFFENFLLTYITHFCKITSISLIPVDSLRKTEKN